MKTWNKFCKICSKSYLSTGPTGFYCPPCNKEMDVLRRRQAADRVAKVRAASGAIKRPGVGKGGNPLRGKDNPSYKTGRYIIDTLRDKIKQERRYCEKCDKDLAEATHYMWVVHHKDHNHANQELSNLELLCKRCHQIEHECWKAFSK